MRKLNEKELVMVNGGDAKCFWGVVGEAGAVGIAGARLGHSVYPGAGTAIGGAVGVTVGAARGYAKYCN